MATLEHSSACLNTGYSFNSLTLPSQGGEIYSAETYYSRHTRGTRTDVVTVYDLRTLAPLHEIVIPTKRGSTIPTVYNSGLSDNDQFMAVYNYTPAQSLTIVDVENREFLSEIGIPGCALVYPVGPRKFASICGDGSMMTLALDESGQISEKKRSKPFFNPAIDPVTEFAVRDHGLWHFVSFEGFLYTADLSGDEPIYSEPWSLFSESERAERWEIGGQQHLAFHEKTSRLYSITHQGKHGVPNTAKNPGQEVWVYDIKTKKRTQKIALRRIANSIQVSKDAKPLLFAAYVGVNEIDIYDALSGDYLRTVNEVGFTPTALQVY